MNKRNSCMLLASVALLAACSTSPVAEKVPELAPLPPLSDAIGLVGKWVDSTNSDKYVSFEEWELTNDSVMTGHGCALSGADTVFIEDLKIEHQVGRTIYSARVASQNGGTWVPFTKTEASGLIFENKDHDWPQRIEYIRTRARGWDVRVSGVENGKQRSERFMFAAQ